MGWRILAVATASVALLAVGMTCLSILDLSRRLSAIEERVWTVSGMMGLR